MSSNQIVLTPLQEGHSGLGNENPPDYVVATRPTSSIAYTFSRVSFNSLVLLSSEASNALPVYYITTLLNVFMPSSHITRVHEGPDEHGQLVGEFEIGITSSPARLEMMGRGSRLSQACEKIRCKKDEGTWIWKPKQEPSLQLVWTCTASRGTCATVLNNLPLAHCDYPPQTLDNPGTSGYELVVTPLGHDHFDQVMLSFLVVERMRLMPAKRKFWNIRL